MNAHAPHPAFTPVRHHRIEALNTDIHEYRHNRLGTPHFHLAAENPENVFLVGLRTLPTDSTGVAHILEHTVLCGSEKYPVRDPFFMMTRRSLNTFMNAFTASDWTAYPFASQNRKDYFNLLDVYLDSVFFSRLDPLDFAQEGHRVEFESATDIDSELVFKGVVFNEMKGAMSSPHSMLWQGLSQHLYPNNTYRHNSGGDPEVIPDLTWEQLRAFYDTHYHPANAVFMTYGDIPAAELQQRFEQQALARFDAQSELIAVQPTRRLHSTLRVEEAYPVADPAQADKSHVVLSWLLGESTDPTGKLCAQLLSDVLLDNSSSPLLKALETTSLGTAPSPLCGLEDSAREMVFVCGLEGADRNDAEKIESLVLDTLTDIAEHGVEPERINSALHQLELSQREIRGDGMPFGLQLVMHGLSTAMLRGDTLAAIDIDPVLKQLREDIQRPDFIQSLVKRLLLDNHHRVRLVLRPDPDLSHKRQLAEQHRLAELKDTLQQDQKQKIVDLAGNLAARQAQVDDPEILPKVTLSDVPEDMYIAEGSALETATGNGIPPVSFYVQGTNGLIYQDIVLDLPALDETLLPVLPLYTNFLTDVGCGSKDYLQMQAQHAAVTGSLYAYTRVRGQRTDAQQARACLVLSGKSLTANHQPMAELMQATLNAARFDELDRLRELVAQTRAAREQSITNSGHALAMSAAASGLSPVAAMSHRLNGLAGIAALKQLDDSLQDKRELEQLAERLAAIHQLTRNASRQILIVGEQSNRQSIRSVIESTLAGTTPTEQQDPMPFTPVGEVVNQVWETSTEVNFCAQAFPTVPSAHADAPALAVLGPYLRNGFLHRAIRENGGAYGGGATQDSDTASFRFFSYRDPRLGETLKDFSAAIDWMKEGHHDPRSVEEAILNVVSSIDKPGSPAGKAKSAFYAELFGRRAEHQRDMRQRILAVTLEDLQRVSETWLGNGVASTAIISSSATQAETGQLALQRIQV